MYIYGSRVESIILPWVFWYHRAAEYYKDLSLV